MTSLSRRTNAGYRSGSAAPDMLHGHYLPKTGVGSSRLLGQIISLLDG
jgi:hypothetical protein